MSQLVPRTKTMSFDEAPAVTNKFENTILFKTEKELLEAFDDLIDDADILSGWNSEGFDILTWLTYR